MNILVGTGCTRLRAIMADSLLVASFLTTSWAWAQAEPARDSALSAAPYSLPVELPEPKLSPQEDPAAPYTPLVLSLISQLEASQPPTPEEIRSAARFLYTQSGLNGTCHNLANVVSGIQTTPRIMPLCFSDGLFIAPLSGPNRGKTTGVSSLLLDRKSVV